MAKAPLAVIMRTMDSTSYSVRPVKSANAAPANKDHQVEPAIQAQMASQAAMVKQETQAQLVRMQAQVISNSPSRHNATAYQNLDQPYLLDLKAHLDLQDHPDQTEEMVTKVPTVHQDHPDHQVEMANQDQRDHQVTMVQSCPQPPCHKAHPEHPAKTAHQAVQVTQANQARQAPTVKLASPAPQAMQASQAPTARTELKAHPAHLVRREVATTAHQRVSRQATKPIILATAQRGYSYLYLMLACFTLTKQQKKNKQTTTAAHNS